MKVKDKIEMEATLKCEYKYEKAYGWNAQEHTIYIMEDTEGQQYKWDTTALMCLDIYDEDGTWIPEFAHVGDKVRIKGTVKDFSEYKGIPQVVLTRCKCLEITYKAPTKEEIADQKKHEQLDSLQEGDFIWEMPYRQYKEHYADCETVAGSYVCDKYKPARIKVIIRNGRMKASGVRGCHFSGYLLQNSNGKQVTYRAVCEENALKHAAKEYPDEVWECIEIFNYCY